MTWGSDASLMPPYTLVSEAQGETDEGRRMRYRTYLDFYNGLQWAERRRPGERRLTVNYARTFVQKGASYLLGKPVRIELVPNGEGPEAAELAARTEAALAQLWQANGLHRLDYDTALDAAVLGDGAFKVTVQRDEGGVKSAENKMGFGPQHSSPGRLHSVVVRAVDVLGLSAGWQGDDMNSLRWVREQSEMTAGEARERWGVQALSQNGLTRSGLTDGATVTVVEHWTAQRYRVEVQGRSVLDQKNPYGFLPYVIFPNIGRPRQCWGMSDLEDIMSLNSEFNVRVSVLSQLLQVSGNPILVLENTDDAEGIRVGPGAVWSIPEGAKAYLLELLNQGGVDLHIKYIELLYKMMHDLAELPGAGFGRDDASKSGVALDILLHPVVQKVQRKRAIWNEVLERRNAMMLTLAGLPVHRSRVIWSDVLPRDRAALVTEQVALVASSIYSLSTARRNLGQEQPEQENERIVAERETLGATGASKSSPGIQPPVKLSGSLIEGLGRSAG